MGQPATSRARRAKIDRRRLRGPKRRRRAGTTQSPTRRAKAAKGTRGTSGCTTSPMHPRAPCPLGPHSRLPPLGRALDRNRYLRGPSTWGLQMPAVSRAGDRYRRELRSCGLLGPLAPGPSFCWGPALEGPTSPSSSCSSTPSKLDKIDAGCAARAPCTTPARAPATPRAPRADPTPSRRRAHALVFGCAHRHQLFSRRGAEEDPPHDLRRADDPPTGLDRPSLPPSPPSPPSSPPPPSPPPSPPPAARRCFS